jgi:hypothetical protein
MLEIIPKFCKVMVDPLVYKPSKTSKPNKISGLKKITVNKVANTDVGDANLNCERISNVRKLMRKRTSKHAKRDHSVSSTIMRSGISFT